jgi:hypothetical protein
MRNCAVALSLAVGFIIAAASSYDGKQFVTATKINAAPTFAFLWVSAGGQPPAPKLNVARPSAGANLTADLIKPDC